MTATVNHASVRDRILSTATGLFYQQGYRATGINQIIAESGVAKASFYDHFPSKDHLLAEYARETARREFVDMHNYVNAKTNAHDRFLAPLESLMPWIQDTHFRGCPFQNLMAEVPVDVPAVKEVAEQHRENMRKLFRELILDLQKVTPKMKTVDVEDLASTYILLLEGAIAASVAYQDDWPVNQAMKSLKRYAGLPD